MEESQIFYDLTHASVSDSPELVKKSVKVFGDAYSATAGAHAIVVCTEWDEFIVSILYAYFTKEVEGKNTAPNY